MIRVHINKGTANCHGQLYPRFLHGAEMYLEFYGAMRLSSLMPSFCKF